MKRIQVTFRIIVILVVAFLGVFNVPDVSTTEVSAASTPTVISTIKVGGGGQQPEAIAVNPNTNRIYTANKLSNNISVIDGNSDTTITTVNINNTPRDVAVNPNTNLIYVTSSNCISVIDGSTNTITATLGPYPSYTQYVAVNSNTNRIYITSYCAIFVIDGTTNNLITTVEIPVIPNDIAVNPNTNKIYATSTGNVSVIDGATNTIMRTIDFPGGAISVTVNPNTNYIYLANNYSNDIFVIDGSADSLFATVKLNIAFGTYSPCDLAVNSCTNLIYVTSSNLCSYVFVLDGTNNTIFTLVNITHPAWSLSGPSIYVAVNPISNRIYTTNGNGNSIAIIDGSNNSVMSTMISGAYSVDVAVNPNTNYIYATGVYCDYISVIDGKNDEMVTQVKIGKNELPLPWGIAVNPNTNRIYVGKFHDGMSVIDGMTNTETNTVQGNLYDEISVVAINPNTNRIYMADEINNMISVVDGATNILITSVNTNGDSTQCGASVMAVNPTTNRVYITSQKYNDNLFVVDGETNTMIDKLATGSIPNGIAINPNTNMIYVANPQNNTISVIDGAMDTLIQTINVGVYPLNVAVNPRTNHIYVTNEMSDNVSIIDGVSNEVLATVAVGKRPWGIAVNPNTNRVYVVNQISDTISVIQDGEPVSPSEGDPWFFSQNDMRWAGDSMNGAGTIGDTTYFDGTGLGCAITCMAMVFKSYGSDVNPKTLNDWLNTNGGYVNGAYLTQTAWGAAANHFGVTLTNNGNQATWGPFNALVAENYKTILDSELAQGYLVIVHVSNIQTNFKQALGCN